MKKVYTLIILILVLSGCGANEDLVFQLDGDNVTQINYRPGDETDPNSYFVNLNTTKSNKENQTMEVDIARDVIHRNNQFEVGSIQIEGENMYITIYPKDYLTNGQKRSARLELRKDLVRALPSYNIHVTVENQ